MDRNRVAKECNRRLRESNIKFEGINYKWAGKYLAMTMKEEEIEKEGLSELVPKRRYKMGSRPGITTREVFEDPKAKEKREAKRMKEKEKEGEKEGGKK